MALVTVTAGNTALATDLNQIVNHLQGASGSTDAWHFRVVASNNLLITLPEAAGAQKVSIRDSAPTEIWAVNSDGAVTQASSLTVTSGGVTVTAGGVTITAGGLTVSAGNVAIPGAQTVTLGGDVAFSRGAANRLDLGAGDALTIQASATGNTALSAYTTGDGEVRFLVYGSGDILWGSGAAAGDVQLGRGAANRLSLASGDSFRIDAGELQMGADIVLSRGGANMLLLATGDRLALGDGASFSTAGTNNITLLEGTAPSGTATDAGSIYVADVAGTTELRFVDSAGGVSNVT